MNRIDPRRVYAAQRKARCGNGCGSPQFRHQKAAKARDDRDA